MQLKNEDILLKKCKGLVENELGWGSSDLWTNQDFAKLSDVIEAKTKVNLSPATLKRLWGKVKYSSSPTTTTLDTLVKFIGYENWRTFKAQMLQEALPNATQKANGKKNISPIKFYQRKNLIKWTVPTCLVIMLLLLFLFSKSRPIDSSPTKKLSPTSFTFESKKVVSESVPNSVLFTYDATAAGDDDTIFIQQSWDKRLRHQVSKQQHNHSSIYYEPGYFLAKLVVNDQVVKEHGLFIRSNGWLPLVEQKTVPVYFKTDDIINDGVMTLPIDKIIAHNINLQPTPPWVAFHNAREFGNLRSDNFIFETAVKNRYNDGAGVCQLTEIHVRMEGGMVMIPLSAPGCVSAIGLFDMDGLKDDSSLLGCDFSDWVQVRLEVKEKKGVLFINGKKTYDLNLDFPSVKIVGLLYRFQGTGSVDFARLSSVDGEVIFEDNF